MNSLQCSPQVRCRHMVIVTDTVVCLCVCVCVDYEVRKTWPLNILLFERFWYSALICDRATLKIASTGREGETRRRDRKKEERKDTGCFGRRRISCIWSFHKHQSFCVPKTLVLLSLLFFSHISHSPNPSLLIFSPPTPPSPNPSLPLPPLLFPSPHTVSRTRWHARYFRAWGKSGTAATTHREQGGKKKLSNIQKTDKGGEKNHIWSHRIISLFLLALHTCLCEDEQCRCLPFPRTHVNNNALLSIHTSEEAHHTSTCLCLR